MFKIYNCIATAHDLWLVGLAAIICTLASLAAMSLLRHARHATRQMRPIWLSISAISTGFGIWSTHFIAMLAYSPGIPSAYNIALTALSLAAAILLTAAGLAMAMLPSWRTGPGLAAPLSAAASPPCIISAWRRSRSAASSCGIDAGRGLHPARHVDRRSCAACGPL
jgi:hypothetical protein